MRQVCYIRVMKQLSNGPAKALPGILYALALALPSWIAGKYIPVIGGPVFAIILGIAAGSFFHPETCKAGIKFTGKKILQYAIVFLGFEMQIGTVLAVGRLSLFVMLFTLSAAFLTAALMWRLLKVPTNQAILIGVGTSICGGSAIAATAPVINANEQDVAQSISTIFLFNIAAIFIFPALGHLLHLSDSGFGLWAGTAVNDTSSVVATASVWSEAAGNGTALTLATIVKLTRTLMIIPVTLVLAVYTAKKGKNSGTAGSFSFVRVFPWFVLGFLLAAVITSAVPIPHAATGTLVQCGKFMIVMAMSAIGLSTDIKALIAQGKKPLILGLACWAAVASVSLAVQYLSRML